MNNADLEPLMDLVSRKSKIDQSSGWSDGSSTCLAELKKEIDEAEVEIKHGNVVYMVDELGDVLWDYLNLVNCLNHEVGVSLEEILLRCNEKYQERISGIESGQTWQDIKTHQKERLKKRAEKK